MIKYKLFGKLKQAVFFLLIFVVGTTNAQKIPYLKNNSNATQLMVHDKPFLMLSGELHNSSSSSSTYMQPIWERLKELNLNSVLASVSWEIAEPQEGVFDFSLVDSLVLHARENKLKLGLIWFASWKNGASTYAPLWVKKDTKRFFRVINKEGKNTEVISPFCDEAQKADAKAFAALMKHIKQIDSKENTVVIIQVENEVGMFQPHDYSEVANKLYQGQVPDRLIQYMQSHKNSLDKALAKIWTVNGNKTKGSWSEVFGNTPDSYEFLNAWYYASYINEVAKAGKQEYALPMYVNAWLVNDPSHLPGMYPCGGPVSRVMDIYKAAAPYLDFQSPDIYLPNFKEICNMYHRVDNPLFIPEHKNETISAATNAVWAYAQHDAICFAPFGIESMNDKDKLFAGVYEMLGELSPLILKYQGTGLMKGVLREKNDSIKETTIEIGGNKILIKYVNDFGPNYGLVIQLSTDEFLVAGNGFEALFLTDKNNKTLAVGNMREAHYVDGQWILNRWFNGDETCGNGARLVSYNYSKELPVKPLIIKIKTYTRD